MTTSTLAAADPKSPAGTPRDPARPKYPPLASALASAVLFALAFPGANGDGWGWLGWFALAPLFGLVRRDGPRWSLYLGAWAGGLTFWLWSVYWIWYTDPSAWAGWVAMAAFLSLWWPAFLMIARLSTRRLGLPLMVAAPVVWVALEYVQAHVLTGFPWYYLAHTQYRYLPFIQIADLTGTWGLSLLMAVVNAWWVDLATLPLLRPSPKGPRLTRPQLVRLVAVGLGVVGTLAYGAARLATADFREGPRLALLQSNLRQAYKMGWKEAEILAHYEALVARAMEEKPDLIVWPETAYPLGYVAIDDRLDDAALDRIGRARYPKLSAADWRESLRIVDQHLHGWVDHIRVPMLIGTTTYDFRPKGLLRYNSAVLIAPGSAGARSYHKYHLVPFGEYVPLIQSFPFLLRLTPFRDGHVPDLSYGTEPTVLDWKGTRFATAICFEDTVPHVVRRFFHGNGAGKAPDVLLNLSNDGWFFGSAEHGMHLAVSVFRCVENRVPLARAVNTGISAVIDGNGRIVEALPKMKEGVLTLPVPLDGRGSLYSAWGDWLAQGCLAVCLGLLVSGVWRARSRRSAAA